MHRLFAPRWILAASLLLYVLLQLPFRLADPDKDLSHSRGPWTDEGLYTLQVRNLLNHGVWNMEETDAVLRSPLFSIGVMPLLHMSGGNRQAPRFFVLALVLLSCWMLWRKQVLTGLFVPFALLLYGSYPVFQHAHLALTDLPAACLLLVGLATWKQSFRTGETRDVAETHLWLLLAAGMKISFAFGMVAALLGSALLWFTTRTPVARKHLAASGITLAITALLFLLFIYLPHRDFVHRLLAVQSEINVDDTLQGVWNRVKANYTLYVDDPWYGLAVKLTWLNLLLLVWLITARKRVSITPEHRAVILFAFLWLGAESLKFMNFYLPTRYLLSLTCVNILLFFLLLEPLLPLIRMRRMVLGAIVGVGLLLNLSQNRVAWLQRSYVLNGLDVYLSTAAYDHNRVVMGNWAASCTWTNAPYLMPLAKGFHNDSLTLKRFHPAAIITETDEAESGGVFAAQGIDLAAQCDSVRKFRISNWEVGIYWLR